MKRKRVTRSASTTTKTKPQPSPPRGRRVPRWVTNHDDLAQITEQFRALLLSLLLHDLPRRGRSGRRLP
jgi:hypothetical protein